MIDTPAGPEENTLLSIHIVTLDFLVLPDRVFGSVTFREDPDVSGGDAKKEYTYDLNTRLHHIGDARWTTPGRWMEENNGSAYYQWIQFLFDKDLQNFYLRETLADGSLRHCSVSLEGKTYDQVISFLEEAGNLELTDAGQKE